MEELKRKSQDLKSMKANDLMALYNSSMNPLVILHIANEIQRRKTGQILYEKRINDIAEEWFDAMNKIPELQGRMIKALRTRARNIVRENKGLFRLGPTDGKWKSFVHWLMEQTPYSYYLHGTTMQDGNENDQNAYDLYDDVTLENIPF